MSSSCETSLPAPVRFRPAGADHVEALSQLWTLFRHDMSQFTGALPNPQGNYRNDRLMNALNHQPGWEAWIATADTHPVGFALLRALTEPVHVLNSFFIVNPARRTGVGTAFAHTAMSAHPGRWAIAYQDANTAAAHFWPHVAASIDPAWALQHRSVPGRPDLPPDAWVELTVPTPTQA